MAGWLYDWFGARVVVPIGGLVLGTALALTGQVTARNDYLTVGWEVSCLPAVSGAGHMLGTQFR
jgi:hypothetical protein